MDLTLQKLQLTLCQYKLYPSRMDDVMGLIRYTYTHTVDSGNKHDRLRAVVLDYMVCYCHELAQHLPFLHLLQEGGSLLSDVLSRSVELVS